MQPVSLIAQGYPRGSKQLIGPFKSLFGPADAAEWFRSRGVTLKTEGDGRMFPVTDDSQTIIDCLEGVSRIITCFQSFHLLTDFFSIRLSFVLVVAALLVVIP